MESSGAARAAGIGERFEPLQRPRWRWVVFLVSGLVLAVAVAPVGPWPFYVTPLVIGCAYLLAAAVGGRRGTLWGPGCVITTWALAVVLEFSKAVTADFTAVTIVGLGVGGVIAALLARLGIRVTTLALGLSVLGAGLTELLAALGVGLLTRGWFYGLIFGGCAIGDLIRSTRRPRLAPG